MNESLLRYLGRIVWDDPDPPSAAADGTVDPAPVVEPPAAPDPAPSPAPAMVPVDVMRRRVDVLTRRNADLERELELARLGQQLDPAPAQDPAPAPRSAPNLGLEARALAEQMRREEKAQAVISAGNSLAKDFMVQVNNMNQMLGQLPNEFLDAVMDAGEDDAGAAQLLYDLAQDLQRAGSIAGMTPTKMAVELTKFRAGRKPAPAATPKAPPRPAAPTPIEPKTQGGRAAAVPGDLADPNLDIDAWMKQRMEGAAASRRY